MSFYWIFNNDKGLISHLCRHPLQISLNLIKANVPFRVTLPCKTMFYHIKGNQFILFMPYDPMFWNKSKDYFFAFLLNILYRINEHQLKRLFSLFRATKITEGDAVKRSFLIKVMCFTNKKEKDFSLYSNFYGFFWEANVSCKWTLN